MAALVPAAAGPRAALQVAAERGAPVPSAAAGEPAATWAALVPATCPRRRRAKSPRRPARTAPRRCWPSRPRGRSSRLTRFTSAWWRSSGHREGRARGGRHGPVLTHAVTVTHRGFGCQRLAELQGWELSRLGLSESGLRRNPNRRCRLAQLRADSVWRQALQHPALGQGVRGAAQRDDGGTQHGRGRRSRRLPRGASGSAASTSSTRRAAIAPRDAPSTCTTASRSGPGRW